jgi:hypothetical protein
VQELDSRRKIGAFQSTDSGTDKAGDHSAAQQTDGQDQTDQDKKKKEKRGSIVAAPLPIVSPAPGPWALARHFETSDNSALAFAPVANLGFVVQDRLTVAKTTRAKTPETNDPLNR